MSKIDKIDSAALSMNEVIHPENYPYVLLSMTIQPHCETDAPYWNLLVYLLQTGNIETVMKHPEIRQRCSAAIERNKAYESHLKAHTRINGNVAVTDFRSLNPKPRGNRYLVYALYTEAMVHMNIGCHDHDRRQILVGVG